MKNNVLNRLRNELAYDPPTNIVHRDLFSDAADQIEALIQELNTYKALVDEFYPHVLESCQQAIRMGPSIDKCDPHCPDCTWYNWAIEFNQRVESGEFDEINS